MKTKTDTNKSQRRYFGAMLPVKTITDIKVEARRQGRLRQAIVERALESFLNLPPAEREEICR